MTASGGKLTPADIDAMTPSQALLYFENPWTFADAMAEAMRMHNEFEELRQLREEIKNARED